MSAQCTICLKHLPVPHMHHTVPRSRGGENSLQIPLCGDCHTVLHANAVYVVSKMRNPKRQAQTFWPTEAVRERAEPWLKILVEALATPDEEAAAVTEYPIGAKLSLEEFRLFKLLAKDLGCSQEQAVLYCVKYMLQIRGFTNEKTKPDLWFLSVPRT